MLHLPDTDLKQTRFYREAFAEGEAKGELALVYGSYVDVWGWCLLAMKTEFDSCLWITWECWERI